MKISNVKAREILDSRGNPTVEVDVYLENGIMGRASVPSGASTGENEALELRDGGMRYCGKGVLKAVANVNDRIRPELIGMDVENQRVLDEKMLQLDGTSNKNTLGANAMLGVSLACMKAAALNQGLPLYQYIGDGIHLPYPMMNILNGGMHADNNLDFQEFMILPQQDTFHERLRVGAEVFHALKSVLKSMNYNTNVGDEGGFAPNLSSNKQALDIIISAIKQAGYEPKKDVCLGLDVAASSFYDKEKKVYHCDGKDMTTSEMIDFFDELTRDYPIISIEDALDENDWDGFVSLTARIGDRVQLVGDDLFTTNKKLLQKGIELGACNAILLKANQIGTVSEMLDTIQLAKEHHYKTIISHRSGETEETFIADLAVGLDLGQIKTGSLSRTDRTCKYNQLLRIEEAIRK